MVGTVFSRDYGIIDLALSADNTDAEIYAEVQPTATDSGKSDDNTAAADASDTKVDISTATFSDTVQTLRTLRAYLEANGCQDYGPLYDITHQVYDINCQKSMMDYFFSA